MGKAGKALKQVLDTYGITQNRLAVAMGTRRSNIGRWFHEQIDPTGDTIADIAKALQAINPNAAGEFTRLYLGEFIQNTEKTSSHSFATLTEVEARFSLAPTNSDQFFTEWFQDLPEITDEEKVYLDKVRQRFARHKDRSELAEGAVNLLLVFPLLELAEFLDEPFLLTTTPHVEILIEEREEVLRGRIDIIIIHQQLWVLIVQPKRSISIETAIPQALTSMMSYPYTDKPVYSMVTDGSLFMFIKLFKQHPPQYDFSDTFSLLLLRQNKLYDVIRVLKRIGGLIA